MIIKYKNEKNLWGWISNVESLVEVSKSEPEDTILDEYEVDYFDEYGKVDNEARCYFIKSKDHRPRLAIFYTDEMYLTDDLTGSTIEILISPHEKSKR